LEHVLVFQTVDHNKPFNPNISDIIIQTLQASEYVIAEQSGQLADVVIHPDLVGIQWHQLDRVDELIQRGEEATRNRMPEIKRLLELMPTTMMRESNDGCLLFLI